MDLRKKMDRIDVLRREIIKLDGELNKVELLQEEGGIAQIKLESGFMMLYDDVERALLEKCVRDILEYRREILQSQIDEKMDEVRELLQ